MLKPDRRGEKNDFVWQPSEESTVWIGVPIMDFDVSIMLVHTGKVVRVEAFLRGTEAEGPPLAELEIRP